MRRYKKVSQDKNERQKKENESTWTHRWQISSERTLYCDFDDPHLKNYFSSKNKKTSMKKMRRTLCYDKERSSVILKEKIHTKLNQMKRKRTNNLIFMKKKGNKDEAKKSSFLFRNSVNYTYDEYEGKLKKQKLNHAEFTQFLANLRYQIHQRFSTNRTEKVLRKTIC